MLDLSQSIDDSAWITRAGGTVYAVDSAGDAIETVRGGFVAGEVLVGATPSGANNPTTAADYLGLLDLETGTVTAVPALGTIRAAGLAYLAR